ncbi:MAG TPA: Na+/H+ antiporter subunit E [Natronosporangium sp.]|nr:Na+/H+ antiporter subunit E [Natronosporangium sp.]
MTARRGPVRRGFVRTWRIARLVVYFTGQFLLSNLQVLWEILTPGSRVAPAIVAVPLRCRTRTEIVSFANLVTLTPGTLVLEIVRDPPLIYLHGMFFHDVDAVLAGLRRLEDHLLAAMRPVEATRTGRR